MTKPILKEVSTTQQGWASVINDNTKVLGLDGKPVPIPEFGSVGALPAASSYDRCIAAVSDASGWTIYLSNGTTWIPLAKRGVAVSDSSAPILATLVADFNALLAVLRTAGIIAP